MDGLYELYNTAVLDNLYSQYWITILFVHVVTDIQSHIRGFLHRRKYPYIIHKKAMRHVLIDICEIGYMPPTEMYPLLTRGGFHYRDAERHFNSLKII